MMNTPSRLHDTTPKSRSNFSPLGLPVRSGSLVTTTEKGIDKRLLTPCRRVGLKRKSVCIKTKTCTDEIVPDSKSSFSPETKISRCLLEQYEDNEEFCLRLTGLSEKRPLICDENNIVMPDNHTDCNNIVVGENLKKCDTSKTTRVGSSSSESIDPLIFIKKEKTSLHVGKNDKRDLDTPKLLETLARSIKNKKEKCKHLALSNLYAKKHDLKMLEELTLKWKRGCQEALGELHSVLCERGHNLSLSELLNQFKIPHSVIGFNEDTDEFE